MGFGRCARVRYAHAMCNLTVCSHEGVAEGHENVPREHAGHRSRAVREAERVLPKMSVGKEKRRGRKAVLEGQELPQRMGHVRKTPREAGHGNTGDG